LNDAIVKSSANERTDQSLSVPVCTVEALEAELGMTFDAVFMDIQGAEREFLGENPTLLSRCRSVILEFHPHIIGAAACEECRRMLRAAGLQLAEKRGLVEAWQRN